MATLITNIAQSSVDSLPIELVGLIEKGKLTLNQAKKITVSWYHEHPVDITIPEIDDYVLASTTEGCPMDFKNPCFGVGFLTHNNIPHGEPQNTFSITTCDRSKTVDGFGRVEKISLEEGKYFIKYRWAMFMAKYPSLWWGLAALRKGIIDPEGWLLVADQNDIDAYATGFDIEYVKHCKFLKSISMDSKNVFKYPDITTQ